MRNLSWYINRAFLSSPAELGYRMMELIRKKAEKKYNSTIRGCLVRRYHAMVNRCINPKCEDYKNYGGRGIECKFESIDDFRDYVMNELQVDPRGLDIDRIDNDGHYEKGNIRIVTHLENSRNRGHKL